jgi:hypothetical protein
VTVDIPERDYARIERLAEAEERFIGHQIVRMLRTEIRWCVWKRVGGRYAEAHGKRWCIGDMSDWTNCPYCGDPVRRDWDVSIEPIGCEDKESDDARL